MKLGFGFNDPININGLFSATYPWHLNKMHPKLATTNIHSTLSSLKFYRHSLNPTLKTHIIEAPALPHYDNALNLLHVH